MDDGGGEVSERARRRREEGESGGLSVADLLARHGGARRSRQANSHRLAGDDWGDGDGDAGDFDADPELPSSSPPPGPPRADARADPAPPPRRGAPGNNGSAHRGPHSPGRVAETGAAQPAPPRRNGAARPVDAAGPNNRAPRSDDPAPELPTLAGPAVPPPATPIRPPAGGPREPGAPRGPRSPNGPAGPSGPSAAATPAGSGPRENGRPPAANGAGPRRNDTGGSTAGRPPVNGTRPLADSAPESGTRAFGGGSGFTSPEFTGVASTAGIGTDSRSPSRPPAGPGGRGPNTAAPVEPADGLPAAHLSAAPEPPVDLAPEDRTELLFGKDELSDATVLLTKLERLGLPATSDAQDPSEGADGRNGTARGGRSNGSWFTPVLGETVPAPADALTDTTVLAPDTGTADTRTPDARTPDIRSAPPDPARAPNRPDRAGDNAETTIIARADGDGPYAGDHDSRVDDRSTTGAHDDSGHTGYADYREHERGYQDDGEPSRANSGDDVEHDDELPQLTSFGIRDTSDKLTTPQSTDKTVTTEGPDNTDNTGDDEAPSATGTPSGPVDRDAAARDAIALRTAKIDETLSRLTAIHAGLGDELAERVSRNDRDRSRPAKKSPRSDQDKASGGSDGPRRAGSGGSTTETRKGLSRFLRGRRSRVIAIVVVAVLLLTPAIGFGCSWWLNGKLRTVDALDATGAGVVDAASQAGDQNYLVVAVGDDDLPQTVVLAHLPAKADRAVLLSVPANLIVDRPGCGRYDSANRRYSSDTVPAQSAAPLADAFEEGGPRCLVSTIQRMTGTPINHFVQFDPAGITPMVDAVNGVPMCVSDRVDDAMLGAVVPTPGQQMMSGEQAKAYATAREVRGEPTDGSGLRMRQQRVLSALLTKGSALSPFLHLPTVASLAGALGANSYMAGTDLGELAALGDALATIDQAKVDYVRIPTADEADTQGNAVLRPTEASKLFSAMRADRPLDGEGDSASSTDGESSGLPPSAVTLSVLNGSSHSGVAGKAADSLRGVGFTVTSVRDSRHQDGGASVIRASADQAAGSTTLARAVPDATVQTVPGTGVLELVLGDSFNGQVQAAPGSTTAGPSLVTAAQLACH